MKKLILITIITIFILLPISVVSAQVLTREQLKVDENLYNSNKFSEFVEPSSIIVVPLDIPTSDFNMSGIEWYKGLYYYMAGRLGLGDILFHYVVTADGAVINGTKGGVEQKINVNGISSNPVLIAYLPGNSANDFDKSSIKALTELLTSVANTNNINPDNISVKKVALVKSADGFYMNATDPVGRYSISLDDIKKQVKTDFSPVAKQYKVEITNVTLPQNAVNPGDDVVVTLSIKNTGEYTIFKGSDGEFIASKKDTTMSLFYINGIWLTDSEAELMPEGTYVKPGETKDFSFKLNIPLYFGEQSEEFQLIDLNGTTYSGSTFIVKLTINRIEGTVLEITPTETGSLNVRNRPSGYGDIVTTVLPGQRFVEIERTDNGWVHIDLGNGTSGWVSTKYTKRV